MTAQTSTYSTETLYGIADLEKRIASAPDADTKARLTGHWEAIQGFMTEADRERYADFKASAEPLTEAEYAALLAQLTS